VAVGKKSSFGLNWRSVLFILIAGLVIYILVPQLLGLRETLLLLEKAHKFWLILALGFEFIFYFGIAVLLWIILDVMNKKLAFWDLIKISFLNNFALHILPIGGIGAGIVNYYFLKLKGLNSGETIIVLVLKNVFTYIALGILLIISIVYLPTHVGLSHLQLYLVSFLVIFAIWLLSYMIYLYYNKDRFYQRGYQLVKLINWFAKIFTRRVVSTPERTKEIIDDIYEGFKLFDQRREAIPYAIFGGLLNWLGDIFCLGIVFLAFGYHIHIGVLIFAYVIANILAIVSWIPGGLGVIEGSLALIIIGFGAPAEITWMSVLVFRLISFWLPIPIGMYSFYSMRRQARVENGISNSQIEAK
jgi:uncharacterized protein (TIRG00374 family)